MLSLRFTLLLAFFFVLIQGSGLKGLHFEVSWEAEESRGGGIRLAEVELLQGGGFDFAPGLASEREVPVGIIADLIPVKSTDRSAQLLRSFNISLPPPV